MNRKKMIILAVSLAVVIGIAGVVYNYISDNAEKNIISENNNTQNDEKIVAPDFTVTDYEGNPKKLSDFFGKPVVVNFWASWCGPCKEEMPYFEEIYNEYKDRVNFVMVNLTDGYQETVKSANDFITEMGYSFPVYYDTELDAAKKYGVNSVPRTYFVKRDGSPDVYMQGMVDGETLRSVIERLLK